MSYAKKYLIIFLVLLVVDFIVILLSNRFFKNDTYTCIAIGLATALVLSFTPRKEVKKQ